MCIRHHQQRVALGRGSEAVPGTILAVLLRTQWLWRHRGRHIGVPQSKRKVASELLFITQQRHVVLWRHVTSSASGVVRSGRLAAHCSTAPYTAWQADRKSGSGLLRILVTRFLSLPDNCTEMAKSVYSRCADHVSFKPAARMEAGEERVSFFVPCTEREIVTRV